MNEKLRKQQKNKTADLNLDIVISTVNVNDLNTPIQVQTGSLDKTKNMRQKYVIYKEIHFKYNIVRLMGDRKRYTMQTLMKTKTRLTPLISDKVVLRAKEIIREKAVFQRKRLIQNVTPTKQQKEPHSTQIKTD